MSRQTGICLFLPDLHMTFYGEGGVCNSFSTLLSVGALSLTGATVCNPWGGSSRCSFVVRSIRLLGGLPTKDVRGSSYPRLVCHGGSRSCPNMPLRPVSATKPHQGHTRSLAAARYSFTPELSEESRVKCLSQGHNIGDTVATRFKPATSRSRAANAATAPRGPFLRVYLLVYRLVL